MKRRLFPVVFSARRSTLRYVLPLQSPLADSPARQAVVQRVGAYRRLVYFCRARGEGVEPYFSAYQFSLQTYPENLQLLAYSPHITTRSTFIRFAHRIAFGDRLNAGVNASPQHPHKSPATLPSRPGCTGSYTRRRSRIRLRRDPRAYPGGFHKPTRCRHRLCRICRSPALKLPQPHTHR